MALKLKYTDEYGIVHINMSPTTTPKPDDPKEDITDPKFDTINNRFAQYDLFGGKYDVEGGDIPPSLFRSRYNSIEEELANTPYAFTAERSLRLNSADKLDITIDTRTDISNDLEDDRFFNRKLSVECDDSLFGPQIDFKVNDTPAFTVTQLIHAQDRYFDLSTRSVDSSCSVVRVPSTKGGRDEAFRVLRDLKDKEAGKPVVVTPKRKKESSFAILAEAPISRPSSPHSLPVDIRRGRVSPFRESEDEENEIDENDSDDTENLSDESDEYTFFLRRGFREETSRHNTPGTSAANSRACSPPRRRTNSLPRIDKMAQMATLPLPIHSLPRPPSPRNFLKENIEEIRELSELNREKHEAEAEKRRIEEEEALLKEMGILDKSKSGSRSVVGSRTNSRSNSPSKIKKSSRSNSPSAILHFENIPANSKEFVNPDDGISKPVTHRSRLRSISKSQPQSNEGSPKHSKIPQRQTSVSPNRISVRREISTSRRPVENNLNKNQRFISNSTSSIHETIKIGSQVHDKRASKSTQNLNISPAHIRGKPPISPGRGGPPPSNRTINAKRLSPIVGTPNKSPAESLKASSAKGATKPSSVPRKSVKTAGNVPATSRLNSRQPSKTISREPSPDKRNKTTTKPMNGTQLKPITRTPSTKSTVKPTGPSKPEPKKPISRTNSIKSLSRTPSTKNLTDKPPLKKGNSKSNVAEKTNSTTRLNEIAAKKDTVKETKKTLKSKDEAEKAKKEKDTKTKKKGVDAMTDAESVEKQDNETQYDKVTNEKGELVILTKKNIVSMTTAAITSQPLEVVTTVTNQLPAVLEKAREKAILERLSSKESLVGKEEKDAQGAEKDKTDKIVPAKEKPKEAKKPEPKETLEEKTEEKKQLKPIKIIHDYDPPKPKTLFNDDHVKLRPLQPPYDNPHVERVKQKIDDILKEPEVSTENILTASAKSREAKNTFQNIADKAQTDIKEAKNEVTTKLTDIKDQVVKQNEKMTEQIRTEATKIVESIMTPVEEPKDVPEKVKPVPEKLPEVKKDILEPVVMVVNEKKKAIEASVEKITETLVKGEGDVGVQSCNLSTAGINKMAAGNKYGDGNGSDKSAHSNGGFPQSTSTTPKPPTRSRKDKEPSKSPSAEPSEVKPTAEPSEPQETSEEDPKPPNFCQRLINKCKSKCTCCSQKVPERESEEKTEEIKESEPKEMKKGMMSKLNCCKKKVEEDSVREMEIAASKGSIEYENETKRKRKFRDIFCACCGSKRRVSDAAASVPRNVAESMSPPPEEAGCCGKRKRVERRDSILSDRRPVGCCSRFGSWMRGACRRQSDQSSSRRTSLFSKNKSLSPTLPPEDTRKKLDTSLVEHTSVMRGAIPVLPIALAYFCMMCNVLVPGLGTILSGLFCLCFGIPRFGVHDGAKHRIGSLVINLLVGCGQLFTVLFCLVGWGWSIWWGVIMIKISRKYRKLKKEEAAAEVEAAIAAPPVTANNHTRA